MNNVDLLAEFLQQDDSDGQKLKSGIQEFLIQHDLDLIPRSRPALIGCITVLRQPNGLFLGLDCAKGRGLILPGGRWEPRKDPSYQAAACRELREETGLICDLNDLKYLWHGPDGYGFTTFAFLGKNERGTLTTTNEGTPKLVSKEELFQSYFGAYYRILFEVTGL